MDGEGALWHSPGVPQRDPRYRPYRLALWILYFTVILVSSGVTIASVVRNLRGPHRAEATGTLPTRAALRVCVTELEALHREQNERAWRLGDDIGESDAIDRWNVWSKEWEQRLDDLGDRCHLDSPGFEVAGYTGREELARARDAVLSLHRAYQAQVNRFSQGDADLARKATQALHDARAALLRSTEGR